MTAAPNPTYDLLSKPTQPPQGAAVADTAAYIAAKAVWIKKNGQALGIMQATVAPVIWQDYVHHGIEKDLFDTLETAFRQVGGASTYL